MSTAIKCSRVYGWGYGMLPATRRRAASMTAAPASIVAISVSWPGQSTKETCLISTRFVLQCKHFGESSFFES